MAQISLFAMHVANLLGFNRIADVRGVTSVTRLFENGMSPCGLYLQIRPQGELYIGQTANLPARFERHLARGAVITELAFMPAHPKTLDEKEKALIAKAERLGLELNNLALRSKHESLRPAFSEIYPEDWVKCWLNPETPPANPFRERYEAIHSGLRHQLDLAMAHPAWPQALPAARQAIRWLIPKPEQSAGIFWSATTNSMHMFWTGHPIFAIFSLPVPQFFPAQICATHQIFNIILCPEIPSSMHPAEI